MSARLALSRVHFPITALGPGRRVGIWFQGCSIRCPGCVSADTWGPGKRHLPVARLLDGIANWLREADGVTISGGEPFDQPDALRELLRGLRLRFSGDILVYSGYDAARLQPDLQAMPGLIDALISGPYLRDAAQTLLLRGSDNQRLHRMTVLGEARFAAFDVPQQQAPALDVMFDADGGVWMAGIPRGGDLQRLRHALAAAGHQARTSQHADGVEPWN